MTKPESTVDDRTDNPASVAIANNSQGVLSSVLMLSTDAIISIDQERRITFFNKGAERIFGYSADEALGLAIDMLVPPEHRAAHPGHVSSFAQSGPASRLMNERAAISGCRRNGEIFPAEASISKVAIDGKLVFTVILRDITRRRDIEKRLQESERRYRGIIENMAETYYRTGTDGKVEFASPAVEQLLGYTPDDAVGIELASLYVDPQGREKFLQFLAENDGSVRDYQAELRCKDGSTVWVSTNAQYVRDLDGNIAGVEGTVRDIGRQKQIESALRDSETRYRQLAELSPDGMYVHVDGEIVFANASLARIFSTPSPADFIGKKALDLVAPEYRDRVRGRLVRLMQGETLKLKRFEYLDANGSRVLADSSAALLSWDDAPGVLVLIRDISDLQRAEDALRQAQKMEAVGQLTGGVAHDFNNLLAVIMGNTELLIEQHGDDEMLAAVSRAANRGAELTQRLLAFSRRQTLTPQPLDLGELLPGLENLFQRTLGPTVEIRMQAPDGVWPVLADPGQLESALLNLAINARHAMPDGGVLEIECSNLELQESDIHVGEELAAGDYVQIAVRDTGCGMSKVVLEHAFEPFFTTKEVGEGSGLGLPMVYGFARQSGGAAVIDSTPGEGTEVKLYLPRTQVEAAVEAVGGDVGSLREGRGKTILVLEDDPDVRDFAVTALERMNYRVLKANDADMAMQVLQEHAQDIDLLLSDIILPGGISGSTFAVKAKELWPELKIVFMTGYADKSVIDDQASKVGEALLSKPFRREELAKTLQKVLA